MFGIAKWIPEIVHHCPNTPYILAGLKRDLRCLYEKGELTEQYFAAHQGSHRCGSVFVATEGSVDQTLPSREPGEYAFVSFEEGARMARDLDAVSYVECSALTQEGLKDVFDEAIKVVLRSPVLKKDSGCVLQ